MHSFFNSFSGGHPGVPHGFPGAPMPHGFPFSFGVPPGVGFPGAPPGVPPVAPVPPVASVPSQGPYGNSVLLNEIHNYFPALLYDSMRFRSIPDVSHYVTGEMRRRFDVYSNIQNNFRESGAQRPQQPQQQQQQQQTNRRTGYDNNPSNQVISEIDLRLQTLFNSMFGLPVGTVPVGFMDPVLIVPTTAEINNGSEVYHMITEYDSPCAICQDVIAAGHVVRRLSGCNHIFHIMCIDAWYQRSTMCPTCRHDIRATVPTEATVPTVPTRATTTTTTSPTRTNS